MASRGQMYTYKYNVIQPFYPCKLKLAHNINFLSQKLFRDKNCQRAVENETNKTEN